MRLASRWIGALAALLPLALPTVAAAQDTLKLAIGQRGNWETAMAEIGARAGIFKKHNLNIERTYTSGGGETMQAVISGAVDLGFAIGTSGAMSAFAKGAPLRIIGAATVGSNDLYWYVKADSPLKSIKEATEKTTIAFSTAGSSTNVLVLGFLKTYNLKAKPTKTGNPPRTLTAVMSGQVDVGWAAPPFGLKEIEEGKIRIVARGSEVPSSRNQMVRSICVHADKLAKDKALIERFMTAYDEALDYMYNDPAGLEGLQGVLQHRRGAGQEGDGRILSAHRTRPLSDRGARQRDGRRRRARLPQGAAEQGPAGPADPGAGAQEVGQGFRNTHGLAFRERGHGPPARPCSKE